MPLRQMLSAQSDGDAVSDFDDEPIGSTKVLKAGWLVKQGGGHKNWKKRWFVLTTNYLKYYKSEKTSDSPQGIVYLRAVSKIERTDDGRAAAGAGSKQSLEAFAVSTPERVYIICGQNDAEVTAWMDVIRAALPNNGIGLQPAEVVKSGYLTKQGGTIKSWRRRWFVLRKDNLLAYYKDEKEVIPLGTIDLEKVTEVRLASEKLSKEFAFELMTAERAYGIFASSKTEMEEWMHLLLQIVGDVVDPTIMTKPRSLSMMEALDDDEQPLTLDEVNSFIRSDTKIVKEGYLTKQGGSIKSWKKRWFVLREATLAYYHDEKDTTPLGLIPLASCRTFQLASQKVSKPYAFEVATEGRTYILSAVNEEEMWEWIQVLQEALTKCSQDTMNIAELRALEKAAELAAQKKTLQLKVIRRAGIKKLERIQVMVRRSSRASDMKRRSKYKSSGQAEWTAPIAASEQKLAQDKADLEEQLHALQAQTDQTDELRDQIKTMQSEIDRLAAQLSLVQSGPSVEARLTGASIEDDDDETPIAWARAKLDYAPNAYDDSALSFKTGDIIAITRKSGSGQYTGLLNGRKGNFPFRYVEELDADEAKRAKQAFARETAATSPNGADPWSDKLDDAAKSLFAMYDSDGDGFMTKLDFFEFLYEFGKTYLSDQQVERCWVEVDVSKRGMVNCQEFSKGVKKLDEVEFFADWTGDTP